MKLLLITFILITLHTGGAQALPGGGNEKKSGVRHYVKKGSTNPVAPYLTPETAADSIQKAVNVSDSGDVVYLMNGTYTDELVLMKKGLTLLGQSRDSTRFIITKDNFQNYYYGTINILSYCTVKNLYIDNTRFYERAVIVPKKSPVYEDCVEIVIEDIKLNGNWLAEITSGSINRISGELLEYLFSCGTQVSSPRRINISHLDITSIGSITLLGYSGVIDVEVSFSDCDFKALQQIFPLRHDWFPQVRTTFTNCHFVWSQRNTSYSLIEQRVSRPMIFRNCTFSGDRQALFDFVGPELSIRNCIFWGNDTIINLKTTNLANLDFKYNLLNGVARQPWMDSTNIQGCDSPWLMAIRPERNIYPRLDTIDRRLDRLSAAIHTGDPSILNVDGSRSDMGSNGGPGGKSYVYPDLAPTPPDRVFINKNTATGFYEVRWNTVCERDFLRFRVYARPDQVNIRINDVYAITSQPSILIPISSFPSAIAVAVLSEDSAGHISGQISDTQITIYTVTAIEEEKKYSDELTGIYPNPGKGNFTVSFSLKQSSTVELTLYSLSGEQIQALTANEHLPAGEHKLQTTIKAASGIYIVRLVVVNSTGEKKEYAQKVSVVK